MNVTLVKEHIYLFTKLPCCTAQEEALCVRLDVNCCKSGCAMGNIPWVRVFSNHECAFPQTRKISFFPLFRWKPFGYWQKVKCLGPISDTGLRECLTSDKGEGYREQEENCIWLSSVASVITVELHAILTAVKMIRDLRNHSHEIYCYS